MSFLKLTLYQKPSLSPTAFWAWQDTEIQTSPPRKLRFGAALNQWVIYDKYMKNEAAKERAEAEEDSNRKDLRATRRKLTADEVESAKDVETRKMIKCGVILERMVNQNNHSDISIGSAVLIMCIYSYLHDCMILYFVVACLNFASTTKMQTTGSTRIRATS